MNTGPSLIYDLSQAIENGMTFYPGDPEPHVEPIAVPGSPWLVASLHLGTHSGTHIDAASHFYRDHAAIDSYPLERFVLPGRVALLPQLADDAPITAEHLEPHLAHLTGGEALILRTGWDRFWKTDRYLRHPYLTAAAAQAIVEAGASLLGIDALNPDSTVQGTSHVHEVLLGNNVLIVENLTRLDQLVPGQRYLFAFLPLRLAGLDGSPVRAIAWDR